MSDRGMKKWAPFASLIEQSECLQKMRYKRNKVEKPRLASEKAEEINAILSNYHGEQVRITYYYDGYIYNILAHIKRIDPTYRTIELEEGKIPFSEIIDLVVECLEDY